MPSDPTKPDRASDRATGRSGVSASGRPVLGATAAGTGGRDLDGYVPRRQFHSMSHILLSIMCAVSDLHHHHILCVCVCVE